MSVSSSSSRLLSPTAPPKHVIKKVLIANRGEIAIRVMRTCKKLGIATVAVYSQADSNALFVKYADEAYSLGNSSESSHTYLSIEKIINAAKATNADAIHPGYGFLSENPNFEEACAKNNIIFIGPSAASIDAVGSKKRAKEIIEQKEPSVPVVPGYNGNDQSDTTLLAQSKKIGYPILIKAAYGGGGKGMRVVRNEADFLNAVDSARTEATNSFGNPQLILERYIDLVRHVEVQIFGDNYGNVIHLFERECSLQRRHQKIIEEAPSVTLTPELREKMGTAAAKIGRSIGYRNAGTVEFIVDQDKNFYFLEVNTRLQVEHPVTECITGLDLVHLQLLIAQGYSLQELGLEPAIEKGSFAPRNISIQGHSIEVRLYAEDPDQNFMPTPGPIYKWQMHDAIRYDTGVTCGSSIPVYYDPLVAKLISHGATRKEATLKMIEALKHTVALGLKHNKMFLIRLLESVHFDKGAFDTQFIERVFMSEFKQGITKFPSSELEHIAIVATLFDWNERNNQRTTLRQVPSGWRNNPYKYQSQTFVVKQAAGGALTDKKVVVEYKFLDQNRRQEPTQYQFDIKVNKQSFSAWIPVGFTDTTSSKFEVCVNNSRRKYDLVHVNDQFFINCQVTGEYTLTKQPRILVSASLGLGTLEDPTKYLSGLNAKVWKVLAKNGDKVKVGDVLVILESMKMEVKITARAAGKVSIHVKEGQVLNPETLLATVNPE